MSKAAVDNILDQIAELPETERLLLEQRLGDMLEREWQQAAGDAQQEAQRRGLDQAAIDRAVREVRHS